MTIENGIVLAAKIGPAVFIVALTTIVGVYWWSIVPPNHPKGLSENAVWLWAPYIGLPGPKRGTWLSCWVASQDGKCRCKTSDKHGRTEYEGVFIPYKRGHLDSESELFINVEQMQHDSLGLFIEGKLVPLVQLKNGDVLIPAAKFKDGKKLLEAQVPSANPSP